MTEPAVENVEWLEPEDLYLSTGANCPIDRPLFQGDVLTAVVLPQMPARPPEPGSVNVEFGRSTVMVVPHPCQCYHGDKLRPYITVAPVTEVPSYDNFGPNRSGAKDKFALPDLPVMIDGQLQVRSHVANFGRLVSIPQRYLSTTSRIACLSHKGLGLLAKRILQFQLRYPSELAQVMAYTQTQWQESWLMQAWVRTHGSLKGYSDWVRGSHVIPALDPNNPVTPYDFLAGALDVLLEHVTGETTVEPS